MVARRITPPFRKGEYIGKNEWFVCFVIFYFLCVRMDIHIIVNNQKTFNFSLNNYFCSFMKGIKYTNAFRKKRCVFTSYIKMKI